LRAGIPRESPLLLAAGTLPPLAGDLIGTYASSAELLGRRTAALHAALSCCDDDPAFAPEPFTPHYQRSIYQHMRAYATRALQLLRRKLRDLEAAERAEAEQLLGRENELIATFRSVLNMKISGFRIRCHGDYHLGQLLYTGREFVIIDFEGEPARPLSERRIKRSALRDVAGMLRSFHYAPHAVLLGQAPGTVVRPEDVAAMEVAAGYWHRWVSAIFLKHYLETAAGARFLPRTPAELQILLRALLLEKACYEIVYELNNRPKWVGIPLRGALQLLDEAEK
jgi:maltose alpha-D-glucosyltransferase/alpha-amylase